MNLQMLTLNFRSVRSTVSEWLNLQTLVATFGPTAKAEQTPALHNLKVWQEFFEDLKSGAKPFEVRRNDRGFKAGDTLRLLEYNPTTNVYSGRSFYATVTYVLKGPKFGVKKGFVVMGLKAVQNELKAEDTEHYRMMYEAEQVHNAQLAETNRLLLLRLASYQAEELGVDSMTILSINKALRTDLPINNRN